MAKTACVGHVQARGGKIMSRRDLMEEQLEPGTILLDGYDEAYIGASSDGRAVYDYNKMVETLMTRDGMTDEEAVEWISYNTIRALDYMDPAPIVVYPVEE